jgi:beta-glucanase (GH16 family)
MRISGIGAGVWPAAWLMGTTDQWPNNGEIDIMEHLNSDSLIYSTLHGGGASGPWQLQRYFNGIDVTQFHTYTIVKKPGQIVWYIDNTMIGSWNQADTPTGATWPFETHNYFGLLNLAIGGDWPGPSNAATPSKITMYVDNFTVKSN